METEPEVTQEMLDNVNVFKAMETMPPLNTAFKALKSAPTPHEALARPHDYEKWYNGAREKALNG